MNDLFLWKPKSEKTALKIFLEKQDFFLYKSVRRLISYFKKGVFSKHSHLKNISTSIWLRAVDIYLVGEIYTLIWSLCLLPVKGFLSIDSFLEE